MTNIYLNVDGLKGECTDSDHKDWIQVFSFNHSITQQVSAVSSGAATTGRSVHGAYTITKRVDMSSPKLYEMCSSGKHIKSVTLEMTRPSGNRHLKYMEVKLEEVVISQVAPESSVGTEFPSESVSFNYGSIKWTYTFQRADGTQGGNTTGGWNILQGKIAA